MTDDVISRLIGISTSLGIPWPQEYRQQVFDTCNEAASEITRLRMRVERLSNALSGLLEAPSGDLYTRTEQNELMRAKDDAMRALGITQ